MTLCFRQSQTHSKQGNNKDENYNYMGTGSYDPMFSPAEPCPWWLGLVKTEDMASGLSRLWLEAFLGSVGPAGLVLAQKGLCQYLVT